MMMIMAQSMIVFDKQLGMRMKSNIYTVMWYVVVCSELQLRCTASFTQVN